MSSHDSMDPPDCLLTRVIVGELAHTRRQMLFVAQGAERCFDHTPHITPLAGSVDPDHATVVPKVHQPLCRRNGVESSQKGTMEIGVDGRRTEAVDVPLHLPDELPIVGTATGLHLGRRCLIQRVHGTAGSRRTNRNNQRGTREKGNRDVSHDEC